MYNTSQEFLSCFLFMINPFNRDLPHKTNLWGVMKSYNKPP
ncbi:cagY like domain protein [Helicobacter pylori Hp H-42]|uniref:CagY like domain protein n=1 Tax=Helicobacter pylori Hp H-42 TaxID=992047 RepID=A0AB33XFM6_HELPX|nr:cagY like domain protein [Helicobacter pylori Hp H-42]